MLFLGFGCNSHYLCHHQQQYMGGVPSSDFAEIYSLAVIDILTEFDMQKWGEQKLKSFMYDANLISAMHPTKYQQRFMKYVNIITE